MTLPPRVESDWLDKLPEGKAAGPLTHNTPWPPLSISSWKVLTSAHCPERVVIPAGNPDGRLRAGARDLTLADGFQINRSSTDHAACCCPRYSCSCPQYQSVQEHQSQRASRTCGGIPSARACVRLRKLCKNVLAEMVLALVVLAAVALLGTLEPPIIS
jgi:hypothetical protein